jgi:hypothetical protein
MSIYKPKGSPFYHYDFWRGGRRFLGSTRCTSRREAEAVAGQERERAKQTLAASAAVSGSLKLDDIAGRYWAEVGQHHAGADDTWRQLNRLVKYFGGSKPLTEITDADVASFVAWRRGHRVKPLEEGRGGCALDFQFHRQ